MLTLYIKAPQQIVKHKQNQLRNYHRPLKTLTLVWKTRRSNQQVSRLSSEMEFTYQANQTEHRRSCRKSTNYFLLSHFNVGALAAIFHAECQFYKTREHVR